MRTPRSMFLLLGALSLLASSAFASPEDADLAQPFAFDLENPDFDAALARAKQAGKLVFLDFFLPG